jgi:hypothetical protein
MQPCVAGEEPDPQHAEAQERGGDGNRAAPERLVKAAATIMTPLTTIVASKTVAEGCSTTPPSEGRLPPRSLTVLPAVL